MAESQVDSSHCGSVTPNVKDRNRHLQEEVNQLQQELSKTRAELKQKDEQLRDERAKRHPSSNKEEDSTQS